MLFSMELNPVSFVRKLSSDDLLILKDEISFEILRRKQIVLTEEEKKMERFDKIKSVRNRLSISLVEARNIVDSQ